MLTILIRECSGTRICCACVCAILVWAGANAGTEINTYDDLGRLKTTTYPDGTSITYTYDPAGNRTQYVKAGLQAPDAIDDDIATSFNTPRNFNPRINDMDANGDAITIVGKTNGANGTVVIISGETLTYTPNTGYSGSDSFSYTISDGRQGQDTATVRIVVQAAPNQPPVAGNDSISVAYNTAHTFDPRGNDSDPDNDPLTIQSKSDGAHGTVAIVAGTSLTYTPPSGYSGPDAFGYRVSDGRGGSGGATVSVTVRARPMFSIANAQATEGSAVVFTVTRSGDVIGTHSVNYATAPGTAQVGSDFTSTSGTLAFTSGQSSGTISVSTQQDGTYENNEAFTLSLSNPSGQAGIGTGTATGTIVNDDPLVWINLTNDQLAVLPEHAATYKCKYEIDFQWGTFNYECRLGTGGPLVFHQTNVPSQTFYLAPGYELFGNTRLRVQSQLYGVRP